MDREATREWNPKRRPNTHANEAAATAASRYSISSDRVTVRALDYSTPVTEPTAYPTGWATGGLVVCD
jgi:hypothetical protein